MSGQAASYYNPNQAFPDNQPGPPPAPAPAQPVYGQDGNDTAYQGGPPEKTTYRTNYGPLETDFDQAFRVEKPKFNDLWAGLLVSLMLMRYLHDRLVLETFRQTSR